jgi:phage terminase large subunit
MTSTVRLIPPKVYETFFNPNGTWRPSRYKILYGGRGGAKTESIATITADCMDRTPINFLCARRFQNSIKESVHRAIADSIEAMGLAKRFDIQKTTIINKRTGSRAIFMGTARSMTEIKSLKGIDVCWVEEAAYMPKEDWQILDPTFRKNGSEIWASFNPDQEDDATYQMFVKKPPVDAIVQAINWRDNPFFPDVLNNQRKAMKAAAQEDDPNALAAYEWVWEGACRRLTDAVVFRSRVVTEDFDEPTDPNTRFFYGADWGYADDPTVLMRSFIDEQTNTLYITHECFAYHCSIDDIPAAVFDQVPGSRQWPIKGDAASPAVIDYVARQGFNLTAAEKWPGSVEDGIAHLRGFRRIVIHSRCPNTAREFRLYSYKTDPRQLDAAGNPVILPVLIDRHNHSIDSLRYSLDGYIQSRGVDKIWDKLA